MGDTSQNDLYYAKETAWGETPNQTATLIGVPLRGLDINGDFGWAEDDELTAGLYLKDPKAVSKRASGSTRHWLRPQNYLDFLVAAIKSATPTPASGGVSTFTNGTTRQSFLLERYLSGDNVRMHYTGAMINRLSLKMEAFNLVEMDIDWMCKEEFIGFGGTDSASAGDGSPTAASITERYDAGPNLGSLKEGGSATSELIRSITMDIDAGLRERPAVQDDNSAAFGLGDTRISGTLSAYFANATLAKKWLGNTTTSLEWTLSNAEGSLKITLPNVWLRSKTANADGREQDQMIDFNWTAHYSSGSGYVIQIVDTDPA